MRRSIPLAVILLVLTGCQPAPMELTDSMKAEIAAQVDATAAAWWQAWSDVEYDRGMSYVLDVPEAAWTGDEGTFYTVAGMNAEWAGQWGTTWQHQQIDFTDSHTVVLAPDIAYTIRQYDATVTDTSGVQLPTIKAVETIVWVKRNDEWKVLLGHESTLKDSWLTTLDREEM